jgi:hypothetical protein
MYEKYRARPPSTWSTSAKRHPSDAWQLPSNVQDKVVYESPKSLGERTDLAEVCVTKLGIKLPALVDKFDDAVRESVFRLAGPPLPH